MQDIIAGKVIIYLQKFIWTIAKISIIIIYMGLNRMF